MIKEICERSVVFLIAVLNLLMYWLHCKIIEIQCQPFIMAA